MMKWRKAAAVLMAAASVIGFSAVSGFSINADAVAHTYTIDKMFETSPNEDIVLRSSDGMKFDDIQYAMNKQSREKSGRTIKLIGEFTFNGSLCPKEGNIIDATEAVISGAAYEFFSMYSQGNVVIKGGVWNIPESSKLAHIATKDGNLVFDSMQVNGGGNFQRGNFLIYQSKNVTIKNCTFTNSTSQDVYVYGSQNVDIVNNTFDNIDGHGIYAYDSENVNTLGNKMNGINGDAVKYCSCKNGNISGNDLKKITRHPELDIDPLRTDSRSGCGMLVSECENINVGKAYKYDGKTYEGNTVANCENYGIHINLSYNTYVYKSNFSEIGSDGIHNSASAGTTLKNCTFKGCKEKGMFFVPGPVDSVAEKLRECRGAEIYNNTIDGCDSFGIMLSKTKESKVEGNTIKNCKDYGIYCNVCDNIRIANNTISSTKSVNGSGIGNNNSKNIIYGNQISLDKKTLSLGKGESYTIKCSDKAITWSTSDKNVAVVSGGKITGISNGTATITAKTNSGQTATCKVTVKNAPDQVTISKKTLTLGLGETFRLSAVIPANSAAATRTFRTSNSSIIKMTKTNWEGHFTALKQGTAWVTVRLYNGKESSCKITVKAAPSWVSISQKTMTMKVGQTASLSASIASNAGCAARTFRTSNSSIIKMTKTDWTGSFKAVKPGTALVTVRTYNGKESSCKITVIS